jgi:hypothetical protein
MYAGACVSFVCVLYEVVVMIRVAGRVTSLMFGAAALVASTFASASAEQYSLNGQVYNSLRDCENAIKNHGVEGSVLGGAAGALIGSSVSGHHSHGLGSGVGAVAGATIGGREMDRGTCQRVAPAHHYASSAATTHYRVGDCAMGADRLYAPSGALVTSRAVRLCLTGAGWATSP